MCGRFAIFTALESLKEYFPIDQAVCEVQENYNVAPTQEIPVIVQKDDKNILDKYHWGLVPFWADDIKIGNKMINARVESVEQKPAFRNAFKKRRCLIPADGFYEWKGKRGQKQPMYLTQPGGDPFAFAGLWEMWDKEEHQDTPYRSCTIITMAASESVRHIHNRMPVVLKPESFDIWLDRGNQDTEKLKEILSNGIIIDFVSHPVSKRVNKVDNNDPSNIESLG